MENDYFSRYVTEGSSCEAQGFFCNAGRLFCQAHVGLVRIKFLHNGPDFIN